MSIILFPSGCSQQGERSQKQILKCDAPKTGTTASETGEGEGRAVLAEFPAALASLNKSYVDKAAHCCVY